MKWKITKNDDEEKHESNSNSNTDSSLILFNINKTNYKYRFENLETNKKYIYKLCLYKEDRFIKVFDQTLLQFHTDKHFKYSSDYDMNGICYFLGTNSGKTEWRNPAKLNKIKLKSSGWLWGSINDTLERTPKYSYSSSIKNSWISFDFGSEMLIKPTKYTLRHYTYDWGYIINWNFLGSLDGISWEIIKKHENHKSPFTEPRQSITFTISGCNQYYQHFKIQMTGKNSNGYGWSICVNGFEVYGFVVNST